MRSRVLFKDICCGFQRYSVERNLTYVAFRASSNLFRWYSNGKSMEIPVGGISKKRHDAPLPGQRAPCHSGKVPLKDDQKGWRWNSWILCNTLTSNRYRKKPRNCRSCSLKKHWLSLSTSILIYITLMCSRVSLNVWSTKILWAVLQSLCSQNGPANGPQDTGYYNPYNGSTRSSVTWHRGVSWNLGNFPKSFKTRLFTLKGQRSLLSI